MKTYIIFIYLIFAAILIADDDYKMPPKAIVDIVDAPKTPNISISPNKKYVLFLGKPSLISIKELSQPELRLAGIRINPATNGRSRASTYNSIKLKLRNEG